jgi:hypothetical protein
MKRKKKKDSLILTGLFLAKAGLGLNGFHKCFYGTLRRNELEDGTTIYYARINVTDDKHMGVIYSMSTNRIELGDNVDSLVIMILYKGLHDNEGKFFESSDFKYSLN